MELGSNTDPGSIMILEEVKMSTIKVRIELEFTTEDHPETGGTYEDDSTLKESVYSYLQELMDDDSLSYEVIENV